MSLSSITVSGVLKEAPQKRFTPTGIPVANVLLEVCYVPRGSASQGSKSLSSQTIRVNAWRDLAEECEQKLKAGDKILVVGRVQINAFTTNEGKKKREIEIDANTITLLNDIISLQPPIGEQASKSQASFKKSTQEADPNSSFSEMISNTEEIPF